VSCVAFSQSARQNSLPGKNVPGALCRALGQNAHGKGGAVRISVFAVRRRDSGSVSLWKRLLFICYVSPLQNT
jgi:hypothetical protein